MSDVLSILAKLETFFEDKIDKYYINSEHMTPVISAYKEYNRNVK